jgi:hypothetical protein
MSKRTGIAFMANNQTFLLMYLPDKQINYYWLEENVNLKS